MDDHKSLIKVLGAAIAVAILLGFFAGARTFGDGNLHHAQQIASRLQAGAMANPSPVAGTPSPLSTMAAPAPSSTTAPTTAAGSSTTTTAHAATAAAPGPTANAPASTVAHAPGAASSASSSSLSPAAATSTAPAAAKVPAGSTAAPRRQPTAAELSQAISAVHSLLPFFTPTVAQLAVSGDQVCTALDQGVSFSQVKSQALALVGAGSISWMIPSSVPDTAVRTLVALYCPANAVKLV